MPSIDQHPSPEQLVAYHERRLAMDQAEDVRAHLADCADCTAELLELADLLAGDGASAAEAISRPDLDAAWQRQRERLLPQASVVPLKERRAGKAWSWATAASLGLAAALAIAVATQWRTIERLEQPQANPPLVNLVPAGSVKRGSREISELRFPHGVERAWVILNPAEDLPPSAYKVVVTAADGQVVLSLHDLRISEAGNLRLEIPRAALKPGDYKILLLREKGTPRQAIEEFKLTVRHLL